MERRDKKKNAHPSRCVCVSVCAVSVSCADFDNTASTRYTHTYSSPTSRGKRANSNVGQSRGALVRAQKQHHYPVTHQLQASIAV